ncbi:MAG: HAD family phosphatase [Oscillospiraceae bacterium]|jgi:HAD superfamily hydrolase (TIGR01509 family)|nr:HAD family phosphatase [Oscillospiraceae bacterium]
MISGVVFDMDGVMFDTEKLCCDIWLEVYRGDGIPITREVLNSFAGMTSESTAAFMLKRYGGGHDYRALDRLAEQRMAQRLRAEGVPVKPGLLPLLAYLREKEYRIALATSNVEHVARVALESAGVLPAFHATVFGDTIARSKPAPDIYLAAAAALGLPPEHCVALEDSPAGIRAAHAAGLYPVMVPDQIQPDDEIRSCLFALVPTLHDIPALLEAHNL